MELDKKQIARLVLGYLKSENCQRAFDEFLIKSKYLKSYAVFVKNGKYFATRVGGLTLEEILSEYSDIALIIQGRLEQTDYYEKNLKMRLADQLNYILENKSRSSSPSVSKECDATPADSLPGNMSNDCNRSQSSPADKSYESSSNSPSKQEASNLCQNLDRSLNELDSQLRTMKQKAEKDPVLEKFFNELIIGKLKSILRTYQGHKSEIPRDCTTTDKTLTVKIPGSENFQTTEANQNLLTIQNTQRSQVIMQNANSLALPDVAKPIPDQSNQLFFSNTGGLLMVPSVGGGSKYILVNTPPSNSAPLNNVMSEADIMRMPTLILEDTLQQSKLKVPQPQLVVKQTEVTQSQIIMTSQPQVVTSTKKSTVTTSTGHQNKQMKTLKPLAPKTDKITIASSDGDYYNVLEKDCQTVADGSKPRLGVRTRSSRLSTKSEASPRKEAGSPNSEKRKKSAKSLFKENKKGKGHSSSTWDSELRDLLIPKETDEDQMDTSDPRLEISINDAELQREAMIIEAAFKTPVKDCPKNQTDKKEPPADREVSGSEEKSEASGKSGTVKSEESEDAVMTEVHLRNCNGPPRIKKKCNLTGNPELFEIVEVVEEDGTPAVDVKEEKGGRKMDLETPQKEGFPKTPGKFEMTPFTKAIEEQLMGMDLLSLPTPTGATPNFPITPSVHLTPEQHSNRPTDYSTSSSYYQPSDTEQNKSLEAVMEELRNDKTKNAQSEVKKEKVSEIKSMFNKTVIGTKNLNLIKKDDSPASDSDSCSDWTGESSSDSDSDSSDKKVKSSYSFRKRDTKTPKQDTKRTAKESARKSVEKPKGSKKKVEAKIEEKCDNENEITDDDFALHLSTDEDSTNKVNNEVVPAKSKEGESGSLPKEQAPAEGSNSQLIQDLYDRGIHLLPKVQAKRTSDSSLEANSNPDALENLIVSSDENSLEKNDVALGNSTVNYEDVTFESANSDDSRTINLVYDSSKRRKKKVYDLAILDKKIEATVYLESLDTYAKKLLSFTPTVTIFDCSPQKVPAKRKRPETKAKTKKDDKPVDKPQKGDQKETPSTLNKNEESSKKTSDKNEDSKKRNSNKNEDSNKVISSKNEDSNKKTSNNSEDSNRRKGMSRRSSRCVSDRSVKAESDRGKEGSGDKTVVPGSAEKKKNKVDDDLMDFAILGEKMEATDEAEVNNSREKRKLSSTAESVQHEKRTKTETEKQAFLKNLNVDLFLNEVHGGGQGPK